VRGGVIGQDVAAKTRNQVIIMSVPPAAAGGAGDQRALLFTPGARLGWIFRDRRELAGPYPDPRPDEAAMREQAAARAAEADAAYQKMRKWVGTPSLCVLVAVLLLAGLERTVFGHVSSGATVLAGLVLGLAGLVITSVHWQKREQARQAPAGQEYQQALEAWQRGATAHEQAELARLHGEAEWGSAEPPTPRVDVFGGSLWGWQALLTTHGASILAAQPLLVVDLTGELACDELAATAHAMGVPSAIYLLPEDMGRSGLLAALSPAQFADALAEAIHAGVPGGARAERAIDVRVLERLTGALGGHITPARLAGAAQAALGHPVPAGLLTEREEALITGELFPPGYRQQTGANLVRLDAFLSDLASTDLAGYADGAGTPGGQPAGPAYLTCLAVDSGPRAARTEVLTALIVQWLTVQVTAGRAAAPAVIVAGADEITRPHLERLSSACERREVPLTLMFRRLRDDGLGLLGGGTAAFMRLGHHSEAEQAASFIGRKHRFVLSRLTATLGGNETHTRTQTEGAGTSDTVWTEGRRPALHISGGPHRTHRRTTSRNWSTALSWAHGTNWSEAESTERVYEYAVEPTVLQSLPDHALLLVTRAPGGPDLHSIECDPAIVTLPRVSTRPLAPAAGVAQVTAGEAPAAREPLPAGEPQPAQLGRATQARPAYLPPADLPPPSRDQWRRPGP
jgi:hypothetical protein